MYGLEWARSSLAFVTVLVFPSVSHMMCRALSFAFSYLLVYISGSLQTGWTFWYCNFDCALQASELVTQVSLAPPRRARGLLLRGQLHRVPGGNRSVINPFHHFKFIKLFMILSSLVMIVRVMVIRRVAMHNQPDNETAPHQWEIGSSKISRR